MRTGNIGNYIDRGDDDLVMGVSMMNLDNSDLGSPDEFALCHFKPDVKGIVAVANNPITVLQVNDLSTGNQLAWSYKDSSGKLLDLGYRALAVSYRNNNIYYILIEKDSEVLLVICNPTCYMKQPFPGYTYIDWYDLGFG